MDIDFVGLRSGISTPEAAFLYRTKDIKINDPPRLLNPVGRCITWQSKESENIPPPVRITLKKASCSSQPKVARNNTAMTRKFGGTGLGLALSRRLASSLGGDVILAWSTPGKGSCFIVTIDAPQVLLPTPQLEPPGSLAQGPSARQNMLPLTGLHVLLAEDAVDSQVLITQFLKIAGAKVDVVRDGAEAVSRAMSDGYDVVLMDVQMPILDGYSATGILRKRGYVGPIIALTAHAMLGEKEKSLQAGCDYHLVKPIDRFNLINTVAMFSGRKARP